MRALMGLITDRHGTYYARHKVPQRLQEAVAHILGNGKSKQVWLKRSLGTKVIREANVRAKPVQMEFDRIIAQAEKQLEARPVRTSLSNIEIKRIAEYFYAHELADDEDLRVDTRGSDPVYVSVHKQLTEAGVETAARYDLDALTLKPGSGLSTRMMELVALGALVVPLIVTWSIRAYANQGHTRTALRTSRPLINRVQGNWHNASHSRLPRKQHGGAQGAPGHQWRDLSLASFLLVVPVILYPSWRHARDLTMTGLLRACTHKRARQPTTGQSVAFQPKRTWTGSPNRLNRSKVTLCRPQTSAFET